MANDLVRVDVQRGGRTVALYVPQTGKISKDIIASRRFYESPFLEYVAKLQLGGTYVNVGAHIGNATVFFSDCCPSESVIAVEPNRENFRALQKNASTRPKVRAFNLAACGEDRPTCMVNYSINKGISPVNFKTRIVQKIEECPCTTVDQLVKDESQVSFIKIDIHHDPSDVVRGCRETLQKHRPILAVDCGEESSNVAASLVIGESMYANVARVGQHDIAVCVPARIRFAFPMFNRVSVTMNLLRDLDREVCEATENGAQIDVFVYDDASTEDVSEVVQFLQERGWSYHRFENNHGKKGFWEVITKIFDDCRSLSSQDFLFLTANDVRLCTHFFARALGRWNSIRANNKAALNFQAELYRDLKAQWTGFPPKRINELVWQTQWNDGNLICPMSTLCSIDYRIQRPDDARWKNPNISSGVWQWFSKRLHDMGLGLYRTHESLNVHVATESSMHGSLRKREPLQVTRFIDGQNAFAKLVVTDPVCASLASIPSREKQLERVVRSLLPQVDVLRVYLNGYRSVPAFLNNPRIVVARSQDHGDRGDAGKFFWCEDAKGYELTCDDDLIYASDYAARHIATIEKYGRRAVVGLHGVMLGRPPRRTYYHNRKVIHWSSPLENDRFVHLVGTGTLGYHASTIKVSNRDFEAPNMADVWFGLLCQKQKVPVVCMAREKSLLELLDCPWTIYTNCCDKDTIQTDAINRIRNWEVFSV